MKMQPADAPYVEGLMNAADEVLGVALRQGHAELTAIEDDSGSWSYAELDRLVNRYGNAFLAAGVEPEQRVLLMIDDSAQFVAGWLGAVRVGAVAVAYNLRASARDLLFVINDSRCKVLLIGSEFLPVYQAIADQVGHAMRVVVLDPECAAPGEPLAGFLDGAGESLAALPMSPDAMAFWVYTSGTTGKPKAAVHLHHDVIVADLHHRENLGVRPGDRLLCTSKMFFAYALGHALLGGLRSCATLVLFAGWPDAARVAELVVQKRPKFLFSVPTFYRNLLRDGYAVTPEFAAIETFVSAGEGLPEQVFDAWLEATGRPILQGIGTTETIFLFIANTPGAYRRGSSGRVNPWAEVRLVDEQGAPITAPDTPGEAWLRMPSICDRYWNRQEQTRAAFEGNWYRTGDMFVYDAEGWWYHQGRADHMLKISGQWVSPTEIEETALREEGVFEAAVVSVSNEDGLTRAALFLVADIAPREEAALAERVRQRLIGTLSVYKCPRIIRFVEEIPRTATGKMQKFKLRQLLEQEDSASGG
jgi:benzoate-CoA ligase